MNKIAIKITPAFFITAAIIGYLNASSLSGIFAWVAIIFVSVLVHEMGHALTASLFGSSPRIELIAFGGLTIPNGGKLKPWKEFLVVLMGPLFGFSLFVFASIALQFPFTSPFIRSSLQVFRYVNLFWTFVNMLPILPLDGGQLLRIVLEKMGGAKMWKYSVFISIFLSALMSMLFFIIGQLIIGGLFLMFILQNIEMLRRFHSYSDADQDEENQKELKEAEVLCKMGRFDQAAIKFNELVQKTQKGLIHTIASECLAKICFDEGRYKDAYNLLAVIEKGLSQEAKCILYLSAYEIGDYKKVMLLSGSCFQERQTVEIALRAAASSAILHDINQAISWLKTAYGFGGLNMEELVQDTAFDAIRSDKTFKKFIDSLAR